MEVFTEFLGRIDNPQQRDRTEEFLVQVSEKFPDLMPTIKWNQPMFTDHGTYIIGFSIAKSHLAVAPEEAGIIHFSIEDKIQGICVKNYSYNTLEMYRYSSKWIPNAYRVYNCIYV